MAAIFTDQKITQDAVIATATDNAKTLSSGKKAQRMLVTVENQDVRMRVGSDPTASIGLLLPTTTGEPYKFDGYDLINDARFISVTGTAVVNLQYILL